MKIALKFLALISITLLIECNEDIKTVELQPDQLIVFCDLSTSLNEDDIKIQSNKLKQIIKNLPHHSYISIYPMDLSIFQDPIIQEYIPEKSEFQSINVRTIKRREKLADSISTVLIEKYHKKNKNSNTEFKSCIISSFEMAYNLLPQNQEVLDKTKVVFMTDMIEQCPESSLGSLYMCSNSQQPNLDNILDQIEKEYEPVKRLGNKLHTNQIFIVITSSYGNQKKCLTEKEQNQVWDKILLKQGFEEPNLIYRKPIISSENLWKS